MNHFQKLIKISTNSNNYKVLRYLSKHSQEHVCAEEIKPRLLRVAIIGMPNVGKSTLINSLMDRKVCAASRKVHTTKKKSLAIFTEDDAQVVFLDTPGIITVKEKQKYNLERSLFKDSRTSLQEADIIGVVHDVSNNWCRERIDMKILRLLEEFKKRSSFLILNKVDLIKQKRKLLELTRKLTENRLEGQLSLENLDVDDDDDMNVVRGWPYFKEIFMISSLTGDGIESLRKYLIDEAKPGEWMFPSEKYSNSTSEEIIVETVRAKFLDFLPNVIPYIIETRLELFEVDETGKITAMLNVKCPNPRIAKLIAGSMDGRLREITLQCQKDLQDAFKNYVRLSIVLEVEEKK